MLVIEYLRNGKRIVKFHKDWSHTRISKGYVAPMKNHVQSRDALLIQEAFLKRGKHR